MTKQNRSTYYLSMTSIILVLIIMLGSFVVSFNVLDIVYLMSFIIFLRIYKINSHRKNG